MRNGKTAETVSVSVLVERRLCCFAPSIPLLRNEASRSSFDDASWLETLLNRLEEVLGDCSKVSARLFSIINSMDASQESTTLWLHD